jgi:hypothetical protein
LFRGRDTSWTYILDRCLLANCVKSSSVFTRFSCCFACSNASLREWSGTKSFRRFRSNLDSSTGPRPRGDSASLSVSTGAAVGTAAASDAEPALYHRCDDNCNTGSGTQQWDCAAHCRSVHGTRRASWRCQQPQQAARATSGHIPRSQKQGGGHELGDSGLEYEVQYQRNDQQSSTQTAQAALQGHRGGRETAGTIEKW